MSNSDMGYENVRDKVVREHLQRIDNNVARVGTDANQHNLWLDDSRQRLDNEIAKVGSLIENTKREVLSLTAKVESISLGYKMGIEKVERLIEHLEFLTASTPYKEKFDVDKAIENEELQFLKWFKDTTSPNVYEALYDMFRKSLET